MRLRSAGLSYRLTVSDIFLKSAMHLTTQSLPCACYYVITHVRVLGLHYNLYRLEPSAYSLDTVLCMWTTNAHLSYPFHWPALITQ